MNHMLYTIIMHYERVSIFEKESRDIICWE